MNLTGTEQMQPTKIHTLVQTYLGALGHGEPVIPAILTLEDHGITVYPGQKPDHDFGTDGDITPDVHFERRPNAWAISVSSDSTDISVVVTVFDDGSLTVKAGDGRMVHMGNPVETRSLI